MLPTSLLEPVPSSTPCVPPMQKLRCFFSFPGLPEAFIWELNPPEMWGHGDYWPTWRDGAHLPSKQLGCQGSNGASIPPRPF